jgi:hypothetical protein
MQGVKKGLQTTHLNEQKRPSQRMSRNQCLLRCRLCHVITTVGAVCGSHAFQHIFQFVSQ